MEGNGKFKVGDKVVAKFTPIDPYGSRKPEKGFARGSVTENSPSPLTVKKAKTRGADLGYFLTFEELHGVFESCYFRHEEEDRALKAAKALADTA